MALSDVYACSGTPYDITVRRSSGDMVTVEISDKNGKRLSVKTINGEPISVKL